MEEELQEIKRYWEQIEASQYIHNIRGIAPYLLITVKSIRDRHPHKATIELIISNLVSTIEKDIKKAIADTDKISVDSNNKLVPVMNQILYDTKAKIKKCICPLLSLVN